MVQIKTLLRVINNESFMKTFIFLLLGMFTGAILEVLGIGILIPFLDAIFETEKIREYEILSTTIDYFNLNENSVQVISVVVLLIFYLLRTLYLIALVYFKNKVMSDFLNKLSVKIFNSYITSDYDYHLNNNSSRLIKNLQLELNFFSEYIFSLLTLITEVIMAISIALTLIYFEPKGILFALIIMFIMGFIFNLKLKKKISLLGKRREETDASISKIILEGLNGIREVIVFEKQGFFLDHFTKANNLKYTIYKNQKTLNQTPRYYFEFVAIIGLMSYVLYLLFQSTLLNGIIISLTVFLAGIFRVLPSLNRIIGSLQKIKFYTPSSIIILDEISNLSENKPAISKENELRFEDNLIFDKVSFSHKSGLNVLNQFYLEVKKGERVGIVGTSGSGKSTLVNILIGLFSPKKGSIEVDGKKINHNNISKWREKIGYVPQNIFLIDDTIKKNIAFGIEEKDINETRINELISEVQLEKFVSDLPKKMNTYVGERGIKMSGGQLQRIGIARALYNNPELLILDEATSALDERTELDVMNSIYNLNKDITILIIAHRLKSLSGCDRIIELKDGKIIKEQINV